jgi:(1->4)-alpha-D-glucan 1-alpha-D-glucosylmutase
MPSVDEACQDPARAAGRHDVAARVSESLERIVDGSPCIRTALDRALAAFAGVPRDPATFDPLHEVLERQVYRLAHWKSAFDEINYRRFFDVNDLGALRMEDPRVFAAAHARVIQWVREARITGLRIDHADGLLDPAAYFASLARATFIANRGTSGGPLYIVAEKILAHGELLPGSWPIAGTTGYGFLNAVNGLFVDAGNEEAFRRVYVDATGSDQPVAEVAYHSKRLVMSSSLASEVTVLATRLKAIAGADRRTRDFTLTTLRRTIIEVIACLPVYRTYVNGEGVSARDRQVIDLAIDRASRRNPVIVGSAFLFLRRVLLAEGTEDDPRSDAYRQFAMKFQQLSAPVQAKGVEDTCFYRYNALLSLNEVGGEPQRFGTSVEDFHDANRVRQERWPREMTATATHDTKRGEDARARLNVLSEMPAEWAGAFAEWHTLNALHRTAVDRASAPDANDEYLFYQALIGAWPPELESAPVPAEAAPDLVARLQTHMNKAIKEAKTHTSWFNQNTAYEDAVSRFVGSTLTGPGARDFLPAFVPFARRIAAAGMINLLAQLVLKIGSPGIPDFYQGTECWQLDLADPDNRRPVDFERRAAMLGELSGRLKDRSGCVHTLLANWPDARIKMFLMACGLRLRQRDPGLFLDGEYVALRGEGARADHLLAFARRRGAATAVFAVPRLIARHMISQPGFWEDTRLIMPAPDTAVVFQNLFTGAQLRPSESDGGVPVAEVFRTIPAAILLSAPE